MRTFRTDDSNFLQGARSGARIAAGLGVKVDFDEFASDADTLGLWHLHDGGCRGEGTGLDDASGHGRTLVNHGAAIVEDGYQFVLGDGDYMDAAIGTFGAAQPRVTLETWVRGWATFGDVSSRTIAEYHLNWANLLCVAARRASSPAVSSIVAWLRVAGTWIGPAQWQSAEADAVLASSAPWHVAAVLDAPNTVRLFVNGVLRAICAAGVQALPEGTYMLCLGASGGTISAVLDEVRLSSAARYAASFSRQRLLAAGMYTSPTHDCLRTLAKWVSLVRTTSVPAGCAIDWEVRAADALDAGGEPQGIWQAYLGPPDPLPDGRYFQWRAILSASADRLASPLVESVEASASDRGYNLYRATGDGPDALDYAEPCARVGPDVATADISWLEAGAVHWFAVRPVDGQERESPVAQGEVRLELDAAGEQVPDRPAGAFAVSARAVRLGEARLEWGYRVGRLGVVPQTFRIFGDGGTGVINYAAPLAEVPYREEQLWYTWTSGPLAPGVEHQLAVRTATAAGIWDEQPAVARVTPDASPPAQVGAIEAEVIL
jgi:hypothetical protein